jgi:hypothetical protein
MVFHDLQSVGVINIKNILEPKFDILIVATLQSIDDTQEVVPWKSLLLPTKASFVCLIVANYVELPRDSDQRTTPCRPTKIDVTISDLSR